MWQVKQPRPVLQRAGLYLLVLSLGPLVLAASLWATSALMATSTSLIGPRSPNATWFLNIAPVLLGAAALACLFYFVPNTKVRGHHAILGGLLASIALDLGKRGFAAYLLKLPTYKTVYGAFATLPLFLGWVYFSWLVTLGAALITANLARGGKSGKPGARPAVKSAGKPAARLAARPPAKRPPRARVPAR
jgi:membrane protein